MRVSNSELVGATIDLYATRLSLRGGDRSSGASDPQSAPGVACFPCRLREIVAVGGVRGEGKRSGIAQADEFEIDEHIVVLLGNDVEIGKESFVSVAGLCIANDAKPGSLRQQ
jgi:hypothetical protein